MSGKPPQQVQSKRLVVIPTETCEDEIKVTYTFKVPKSTQKARLHLPRVKNCTVGSYKLTVDNKPSITFIPTNLTPKTKVNKWIVCNWNNLEAGGTIKITITTKLKIKISDKVVKDMKWKAYNDDVNGNKKQLEKYLKVSTKCIQFTFKKKADHITKGKNSLVAKIDAISSWMCENIHHVNSERPQDPISVWKRKNGICDGQANLMAALLRSVGIPTRVVGGLTRKSQYIYKKGRPLYNRRWEACTHSWVEVWCGTQNKWLPCDPGTSIFYVDGAHIKCGDGSNFDEITAYYEHFSRTLEKPKLFEPRVSNKKNKQELEIIVDQVIKGTSRKETFLQTIKRKEETSKTTKKEDRLRDAPRQKRDKR